MDSIEPATVQNLSEIDLTDEEVSIILEYLDQNRLIQAI